MSSVAAPVSCPDCAAALVRLEDEAPWCGRCEWNLDAFVPVFEDSWVWRWIARRDRKAGFRFDRRLARSTHDDGGRGLDAGYLVLLLVSGALLLLLAASLVAGVWFVASGFFPLILLGLLLIGFAYALRPRLGRLRRVMRGAWRLGPDKAPALHALVNRIAERVGAPVPDVLAVNLDLNAGASVVGLRRTRVLMLGAPLLLALNGQQLAALIGHELGHFYHQHTLRSLLVQPARTVFGALSYAVRPPKESVVDQGIGGIYALVYLVYQLVAGLVSWLLFLVHLTMNILGARDDRRAELHADRISVQAAGSTATLGMIDTLAMLPLFVAHLNGYVDAGRAAASWRGRLAGVRERNQEQVGVLRQLSMRDMASLFASHPAPGRRHQWLSGLPHADPAVVVSPTEAERIEAELAPYAESLRNRLADVYGLE